MSNWIEMENKVGEAGKALINLDSGMVVHQVENLRSERKQTKIWSLHSNERYLQGDAELFDCIKEKISCMKQG
jgi:hypothetical protein